MKRMVRDNSGEISPKRVALYLRTSSLSQARDGYGLEMQERSLRALVESNAYLGWVTNDDLIYREDSGMSGASGASERPVLSQLKIDILAKKIDVLLIWKIDRLFRRTSFMLEFIDFLEENNVVFVSRSENIDLSTSTGKLALAIFSAMAESERDTIAERTMEGKYSKALEGYIVYGKNVPYGYRKYEVGKGYKLAVDPEEAIVLKEIFSMFVEDGMGTGEIARILTARGIGTNIDRRLATGENITNKLHKGLFRQDGVARMLRNTTYIGEYACNKRSTRKKDGKTIQRFKDESEWIRIPCEAIIDKDIFMRAQDILDKAHTLRRRGESHLFTGLIKCGECGRSFNYYKSHRDTGQYRCGGKKKDKVSKENLCKNRDISELKLLDEVWPQIEHFLRNPKDFLKRYEMMLQEDGTTQRRKDTEAKFAKTELDIIKKKELHKNALRKELEGGDNSEAFKTIALDVLNEIRSLENLKNTLQSDLRTYEKREEAMNAVLARSKEYRGNLGKITDQQKGELIREFVYQVELSRLDGVVEFMFEKV